MRKSFWYRAGPWVLAGGTALLGGCTGNGATDGGNTMPDMAMPAGMGDMAMSMPLGDPSLAPATTGGDFMRPFDAVPDPDAQTFYFTAMNAKGMGVFKVNASGGAASEVSVGAPFLAPFGIAISSDGKTLFVADHGAGGDPMAPDTMPDAPGAVYSLASGGGMPAAMTGTAGYNPCAVEVRGNELFFTGVDPADGMAGLFKIPTAGGAVTVVAKGDPFGAPCGVALTKSGEAYVADTAGAGRVIKVSGSKAAVFAEPVPMGFPAGIAITFDEKKVLVSGQGAHTGTSVVYVVDIGSGAVSEFSKGFESSTDSGGLHRAANDPTMSWCGVTVGNGGQGTVFQVTFK